MTMPTHLGYDYRIDLKAPGVQKNFCRFATTKRPIRYGYTTKDLLKLVKNSEADLFIIQLSLKSRLLDNFTTRR